MTDKKEEILNKHLFNKFDDVDRLTFKNAMTEYADSQAKEREAELEQAQIRVGFWKDHNEKLKSQLSLKDKEIEELKKERLDGLWTKQDKSSMEYEQRIKELEEGLEDAHVNLLSQCEFFSGSPLDTRIESLLSPSKEKIGNPIQPQNPLDNAYEV